MTNKTGRCDGTCDTCECPVDSDICRRCHGEGVTYTGITESPRSICNACDGTGYRAASQPLDSEERG